MNSLYDIYLGDVSSLQGYRCRSLTRDSAPLIAPRFSTGSAGQTDLDLLKSKGVDNLAGGMFQRTQGDPQKVSRSVGFYNPYDENFYPTLDFNYSTTAFGPGNVRKVENNAYSFIAMYQRSAGQTFILTYKTVGSTVTSYSNPASGTTNDVVIGNMCIHKGFLYVGMSVFGKSSENTRRLNIAAGTWQDIAVQDALYVSVRNILYSVDNQSNISVITNETVAGAATKTAITTIGGSDIGTNEIVEFNGAAWAAKNDGIYRFDGVTAIKVVNINASKLTVWNGALYFFANKWLYRFDGTNVVKLQYFDDTVYQISVSSDYLLVQTWVTTISGDTPKGLGSGQGFCRIFTYDGTGFDIMWDRSLITESFISHGLLCNNDILFYVQPQFNITAWDNCYSYRFDLTQRFTTAGVTAANSNLEFTTSEFDDGYPNIFKSLEYIEPLYNGMISGDVLTIKYQYYDGKTWSSWITAGTLTSSSTQNLIPLAGSANKLFKRLKINVSIALANGSAASLKGVSWRYTLQPRLRWRWQAHVMTEGNGTISDRSGAKITADANSFTNKITQAARQKTPLFMLSPDYGVVNAQINSSALSFVVKGQAPIYTDPYSEYPLVAAKNFSGVWEIMRVSGVSYDSSGDLTTITVLERGYAGVTPAQINAGAEFHLAYTVYVTRVLRDAPVLDENTYLEQAGTGESQLQREWMLELTEI